MTRTWHDVVVEAITDPATGRFRRGSVRALISAARIPQNPLYKVLAGRKSPRNEIAFVYRLAEALKMDPLRLLMPEQYDTPSRRLITAAEYAMSLLQL